MPALISVETRDGQLNNVARASRNKLWVTRVKLHLGPLWIVVVGKNSEAGGLCNRNVAAYTLEIDYYFKLGKSMNLGKNSGINRDILI